MDSSIKTKILNFVNENNLYFSSKKTQKSLASVMNLKLFQ